MLTLHLQQVWALGVTESVEKEISLNRLGDALKRLLTNPDPEVEGGHDHASPVAPRLAFRLAICSFPSYTKGPPCEGPRPHRLHSYAASALILSASSSAGE